MIVARANGVIDARPTVRTYSLVFEMDGQIRPYYPISGQDSLVTNPEGPEARSVEKMFAYDYPTFDPTWVKNTAAIEEV